MLSVHKKDGGEFAYALDNMGKVHGFIVAWSLSLCYLSMIPLNASAYILILRLIFKEKANFCYLYTFLGTKVYLSDIVIMAVIIFIFAYINIKGLYISSKIQNILISLLVIIVFGITVMTFMKSDLELLKGNYISDYRFSLKEISTVVAIVPFLFVGFDVVPQVATDLKFKPEKTAKLSVISIAIGILVYSALNLIAGLSFSKMEASKIEWAVASSIILKLGYTGFLFMLIALLAAVTGGINGFMIASSKLIASLGERGIMNKKYGIKNRNNVSVRAVVFVSLISLTAGFAGREVIIYIVDMASVLAAVAYAYVSYIAIRYKKKIKGKIISCLSLVVSILFIVLLLFPLSPAFLSKPSIIYLAVWSILGIIVYNYSKKKTI